MTPEKDEQDLVKALDDVAGAAASVGGVPAADSSATATTTLDSSMPTPTLPVFPSVTSPSSTPDPQPSDTPSPFVSPSTPEPQAVFGDTAPHDAPVVAPADEPSTPSASTDDNGPLAAIKKDALVELRPLVDKLNVSSEEKFDTYLLLIRSTDDTDLIGPAHEAAKAISDETRRAEALLDIIKEIDYLSQKGKSKES